MTRREIIKQLKSEGWKLVTVTSSHLKFLAALTETALSTTSNHKLNGLFTSPLNKPGSHHPFTVYVGQAFVAGLVTGTALLSSGVCIDANPPTMYF